VTNDLPTRLQQHYEESKISHKTFTGRYNCYNLLYYERFSDINHAIDREKEIKGWLRIKKERLIESINPRWRFLNEEIQE